MTWRNDFEHKICFFGPKKPLYAGMTFVWNKMRERKIKYSNVLKKIVIMLWWKPARNDLKFNLEKSGEESSMNRVVEHLSHLIIMIILIIVIDIVIMIIMIIIIKKVWQGAVDETGYLNVCCTGYCKTQASKNEFAKAPKMH